MKISDQPLAFTLAAPAPGTLPDVPLPHKYWLGLAYG